MEVRKLQGEERFEAELRSLVAFHYTTDDIEKMKENAMKETCEDWGAFNEENELMSHIINGIHDTNFDGHIVKTSCIGAVSTNPEYRGQGDIRHIFEHILPSSYENGVLLSALYPFSHFFYRKFGYETVLMRNEYAIPPVELKNYSHKGWVKMWKEGDDLTPYLNIYNKFAEKYNLSFHRTEEEMKNLIHGTYYTNRYFVYLIGDAEGPLAYVCYQDVRQINGEYNREQYLTVSDYAYDGKKGFKALLGFLSRFTADYKAIKMKAPTDLEMLNFVADPYNIKKASDIDHMVRVVNALEMLKLSKKPAGCDYTIEITGDEILPQNNGIYHVTETEVTFVSEGSIDMSLDIHAFSVMLMGGISFDTAVLRSDVTVYSNEEMLRKAFPLKALYLRDQF